MYFSDHIIPHSERNSSICSESRRTKAFIEQKQAKLGCKIVSITFNFILFGMKFQVDEAERFSFAAIAESKMAKSVQPLQVHKRSAKITSISVTFSIMALSL